MTSQGPALSGAELFGPPRAGPGKWASIDRICPSQCSTNRRSARVMTSLCPTFHGLAENTPNPS